MTEPSFPNSPLQSDALLSGAFSALALLDEVSSGWVLFDREGIARRASEKMLASIGYQASELAGKSINDLFSQDNLKNVPPRIDLVFDGEHITRERVLVCANGREIHTVATAVKFNDELILVTFRSVQALMETSQQLTRETAKLRVSETRLEHLIEAVPGAIYRCDCRGSEWRMSFFSEAIRDITGYRPDDFLSASKRSFDSVIHENDLGSLDRSIREALHRNESWSVEYRINHRDGEVRWVYERGQGTFDRHGKVQFLDGLIIDITESRRHEEQEKALRAQLLQAQRLENLGRIAGGIAHDFNNFISPILGYAELALRRYAEDPQLMKYLGVIELSAKRATELTARMLRFSKKMPLKMQATSINEALSANRPLLESAIPDNIEFLILPDAEMHDFNVMLDQTQLAQILMNLTVNGVDAMEYGGKLSISSRVEFLSMDNSFGVAEGEYAALSVQDTGAGMEELAQMQVFEPFYSTKGEGKGTGLGLSTTFAIMEQHGGAIDVASKLGVGSTFTLYFPRTFEEPRSDDTLRLPDVRAPEDALVLVVEDDALVLELMETMLASAGYRVISASNAEEAIALAEKRGSEISLLLSDVMMPRVNGRQLYDRLATIIPKLPVIFVSGYTGDLGPIEPEEFLAKPFSCESLLAKVAQKLANHA